MAGPLKILYLIDIIDGDLSGTENQLIKMISGLQGRFDIQLVCFDDSPWFREFSGRFGCGSRVYYINKFTKPYTYINLIRLIWFMRKYKPDVVHTFFPVGNSLGVMAARLAGIKSTISSRRDYGEWMNGRYLMATRMANRFVTKIIANSQEVKELTEKREKTRNGQVGVILNGIDTASFINVERDTGLKKRLGIPDEDKVVGIVANFRPMKRHQTFLHAACEILKTDKNVSFVLVGQGYGAYSTEEQIKALGESLNIKNKLFFVGSQKNVIPYLSIMDVGVNCSEMEGLSNAIMEYMAAGVPCVVSRAGGNSNLITNNENGYTFELNDYKTLAELIVKLLQDDKTRRKFIDRAREKIEKEMSLESMLSSYETLYKKLAKVN